VVVAGSCKICTAVLVPLCQILYRVRLHCVAVCITLVWDFDRITFASISFSPVLI